MKSKLASFLLSIFLTISIFTFAEKNRTAFTENKGQFRDQAGNPNPDVLYMADFGGMKVQLRKTGFSYETYEVKPKWVDPASIPYKILTFTENGDTLESWPGQAEAQKNLMYHFHRVDVELVGAKLNPEILAEGSTGETKRHVNVENGGESIEVTAFSQVRYNGVYPGIDLVVYSQNENGGFKYDFILKPGANLATIELEYKGAESIELEKDGNLNLRTRFGVLSESIPACYTEDAAGNRKEVFGIDYHLEGNKLKFTGKATTFDEKLVIDPAVGFRWAAFFGGEGFDECTGEDIDITGAHYLCGNTTSYTNIATFGSFEDSLKVPKDGFLAKYSESGVLVWSTYLNNHLPNDIVISKSNNPIIANDLGVMKFDSDCNFIWYEELGSPQKAICCDKFDNIVTLGDSILKLNSEGVQVWKRGFGSDGTTFKDVGCDTFGNIFIAGHTTDSSGISTPNSYCQQFNGNNLILTGYDYNFELIGHERQGDGFFIKLDSSGNQLYGSYFGGEYFDIINKISVSDSGLFVIGGETNSRTGIASSGAFQTQLNPQPPYGFMFIAVGFQFPCPPDFWPLIDTCISGAYYVKPFDHRCQSTDSFIAVFNADGTSRWSTYYGDYNSEVSTCVNVSSNGDTVAVAGLTTNFNWPAIPYKLASTYTYLKDCGDYPNTQSGVGCGYVAQFNSLGVRAWGSYFPKEDDVTSENLGRWRVSDTRVENNEVIVCGTTNVSGGFAPAFPPNNFINSFASSNIDTIVKPHNSSFCVGDSVVLTVGVITSSPGDLDFIWEKCGVILQGEKDSTIVVHYNEADTGWYCYHIVQGNYSFTDSVHINVSNGNEFDRSDDFIMNHFSSDCKFGDFDGNGELDFALLGSHGFWGQSEYLIYRNVSQDFALDSMSVGLRWGSFCVSDFNLDGEIDIIASGSLSGVFGPQTGVTLYYFGDSSDLTLSQVDSNQYYKTSLDYADFDNDGDYDLLITGSQDNGWATAMVKENNDGDLSVQATSFLPIGNGTGLFADFNNDMQIDVITAGDWGCYDKNCKVFFRSHNAYSLFQTPLQVTGHTCWESAKASAAVGDIDADGDIDFCISGATNPSCCDPLDPKVLVYINNGTIFSLDTMLAAEIGFRTSLGDIDNDGYLDIINGKNVFINSNGSFNLTPTTYGIAHSGLHENISGNYKEVNQSLGDYDNDGDLDFLTAFGLYRNDVCNYPNTPPNSPFGLTSAVSNDTVFFSWQRATDLETPQMGLTYNLRVGTTPGGNDIMSSLSDSKGWRKVVGMGNVFQNTSWWLHGLAPGTYYWSVQAIDNSFAGGPFAPEHTFEILTATHNISIPEGWSGLSSWAVPHNPAIEEVLLPIQNQLTVLQTMDAFYFPSQNTNTIGTWENQSTYKIKVSDDCLLNITGIQEQNKNLVLEAGWNLIPVICNIPVDAVQLFAGISNDLKIAKDVAGSGVYWPEYGINSIGSLLPGKAYFVKMNNAGTITFPPNDFSGLKTSYPEKEPEQPSPWGWVYKTPSSHIFALPANTTSLFGDEFYVGAFTTEGICAGTCFIEKGICKVLVVNSDDALTPEKEGFTDGEPLSFRIWDANEAKDYLLLVEYDFKQPNHSGVFAANGISAIRKMEMFTNIQEQTLNSIRIFPNPTSDKLNISGIRPETKIHASMISPSGKVLFTSIFNTDGQIDVSRLSTGIYFLKLEDGNSVRYEKVVKK